MLESATVTLKYSEFKELNDRIEELKKSEKMLDEFLQEREEKKEVKAMDKMIDLLADANDAKTLKKKQELIIKSIEVYCNTFDIPIEEFVKEEIEDK